MNKIIFTIILFLSAVMVAGCAGVDTVVYIPADVHMKERPHENAPPPHAPAHGYRHKHQNGVELEYDSGIDAYLVIEFPGTYFYNGLYLRVSSSGNWVVAAHCDGPWRVAEESDVPPKLKMGKGKNKGSKKGKKNKKV